MRENLKVERMRHLAVSGNVTTNGTGTDHEDHTYISILFPFGIIIQTFSELLNDNLSICLSNHLFMALLLCTLCQTTENIMVLRYITLCVLFALSLFCD